MQINSFQATSQPKLLRERKKIDKLICQGFAAGLLLMPSERRTRREGSDGSVIDQSTVTLSTDDEKEHVETTVRGIIIMCVCVSV